MIQGRRAPHRDGFRHGRRWAKPIDQSTVGEAVRAPGIDPRQWVSIGIVTAGGQEDEIVVFDEDEGQPLVRVLLEPTKIPVVARVAGQVAGNGEGDWFPFVEGDEVVVAIPEGSERSGCVIIGRLPNSVNKFPMESVAGQDPTTNTFAFSRRRTAVIQENSGPVMFRSAESEALFGLDKSGVFTVKTGDRSALQMSPDVIGFQGPSDESTPPDMIMQINVSDRQFSLNIGEAVLNLSASDATPEPNNLLSVPDNLTLNAGGNFSGEHMMTAEAFWHCLQQQFFQMSIQMQSLPVVGSALSVIFAAGLVTTMPLAMSLAAVTPILPTLSSPLSGLWPSMPPKLPSAIPLNPGLGSATIIVG